MHAAAMIVNDPNTPYKDKQALFVMAICSKTPISGAQLREVFVNWAGKHQIYWQRDDGFGAWAALQAAWPCQKPK